MSVLKGGILLAVSKTCNHCNKARLPHEIATGDERRGYLCWNCLENHWRNLADLTRDGAPRGCNECGISFERLEAIHGKKVPMVIVTKDGILQILCRPCNQKYAPKAHVFRNTEYGRRLKEVA